MLHAILYTVKQNKLLFFKNIVKHKQKYENIICSLEICDNLQLFQIYDKQQSLTTKHNIVLLELVAAN